MVRGVTPELLLGNDYNQNGFLDSDDDPADENRLWLQAAVSLSSQAGLLCSRSRTRTRM